MKNFVALIFFISTVSFGQTSGFSQISNLGPAPGVPAGIMLPDNFMGDVTTSTGRSAKNYKMELEIVNSPFLEDEYQEGETTIHGKLGFKAKLRYNAGKDVIEFIDEDNTTKELLRRPYIRAEFHGKEYVILEYKEVDKNIEKLGYFNPLNKGVVQLLLMPKKN